MEETKEGSKDYEYCFIVYDDEGVKKEKKAHVRKDDNGVSIKLSIDSTAFFIPYNRVYKIKKATEVENGQR